MKNEKMKNVPAARIFVRVGPWQKPDVGADHPPGWVRCPGFGRMISAPTRRNTGRLASVQTSELEKWLPPSRLTSARLPP